MSSVLIDNWSLNASTLYLAQSNISDRYNQKNLSVCWQNFLTALVLWDKINFVLEQPNSNASGTIRYYTEILREKIFIPLPFKPSSEYLQEGSHLFRYLYHDYSHSVYETMANQFENCSHHSMLDERKSMHMQNDGELSMDSSYANGWIQRTMDYLGVSNNFGISYLPHPARAEFLRHSAIMALHLNRQMIIDKLDQDMLDFFKRTNALLRKKILKCEYPLIYDLIRRNASIPQDELKAALEIRNDKDVISFRQNLTELEDRVGQGDIALLHEYLSEINAMEERITKKFKGPTKLHGEFEISVTPSVSIPFEVQKSNRKFNLAFLTRLVDFSIHERLRR